MSPKVKKILNIVVDVVVGIVLLFALLLAICTISSKAKGYDGYTGVFGKAYLAVSSDSMKGDKEDNFKKGDLIKIDLLKEDEIKQLEVGDVITYETVGIVEGKRVLNSHRITEIIKHGDNVTGFHTKGDYNATGDTGIVLVEEVVGKFQKKAGGIGKLFLFMNSSTGFFVCIVLPTLIVVAFCAVNLVLVIRREKKAQTVDDEQSKLDERERIRQELLAEMQAQGGAQTEKENEQASADESKEPPKEEEQEPATEQALKDEKKD